MSNGSAVKPTFDPRLQVLLQPLSIDTLRVFVNPPVVCIGEGDKKLSTVQWINNTSEVAELWIPNGDRYFETPKGGFSASHAILPGKDFQLKVKAEPDRVRSQYHVYCAAIKGYAEGNSPPVVSCP
jgi:hypothetical protein